MHPFAVSSPSVQSARSQRVLHMSDSSAAPESGSDDLVACRITVTGDVNGGYYRACVLNEVGTKITALFWIHGTPAEVSNLNSSRCLFHSMTFF